MLNCADIRWDKDVPSKCNVPKITTLFTGWPFFADKWGLLGLAWLISIFWGFICLNWPQLWIISCPSLKFNGKNYQHLNFNFKYANYLFAHICWIRIKSTYCYKIDGLIIRLIKPEIINEGFKDTTVVFNIESRKSEFVFVFDIVVKLDLQIKFTYAFKQKIFRWQILRFLN